MKRLQLTVYVGAGYPALGVEVRDGEDVAVAICRACEGYAAQTGADLQTCLGAAMMEYRTKTRKLEDDLLLSRKS